MTASRMISALLWKYLKGSRVVMAGGYEAAPPVSTGFLLTRPVERLIAANLTNPDLDPDMIASACGISKRYLHELFTDVNKTVSQHIREQRLLAARQCLDLPNSGAIADVAYRYGFADQAQFSRLFKRMFEISPSGYRAGTPGGS